LAVWREIGISKEEISLVVNRNGAKYKESLNLQDAERIFGRPVDFLVSNDIKTVVQAENQAKTLMEMGQSMPERQIRDIARALMQRAGKPVEMEPAAEAEAARGKKPLFPWRGKS
jgi:Flp pilus assembly CpaE family ATPase